MSKFVDAKFRFSDTNYITEVGISGGEPGYKEQIVFRKPILLKAGVEISVALAKRIVELEAQVDKAIKWIQCDCPWDEETIRAALEGKDNA